MKNHEKLDKYTKQLIKHAREDTADGTAVQRDVFNEVLYQWYRSIAFIEKDIWENTGCAISIDKLWKFMREPLALSRREFRAIVQRLIDRGILERTPIGVKRVKALSPYYDLIRYIAMRIEPRDWQHPASDLLFRTIHAGRKNGVE